MPFDAMLTQLMAKSTETGSEVAASHGKNQEDGG